ncbi:MAG: cupin domain-containing protein [Vicinamibacteria bacterium]|nr:cupin domain-containing protein [Vicinamibacteria bacterium]
MRRVFLNVAVAVVLVGGGYAVGRAQGSAPLKSGVVTAGQTVVADSGTWGEFHRHFGGATSATAEVLAGYADIKAGSEPHPPHVHVDEEFLYLVEGSGTWSLNGKAFPAKAGDVLYTAPNDQHGLKNTSEKPLRFFVVKWRTK